MQKKLILGAMFVLFLLVSPLVIQGSAFNNYFAKRRTITASTDGAIIPFWYFCHINSSGYGKADYSGDNIFMGIRDYNATIIIKSLFRENKLNGTYNIQIFFFIGNATFSGGSGEEGYCHLDGWAMLVNIW
jgi:hypothetical protein